MHKLIKVCCILVFCCLLGCTSETKQIDFCFPNKGLKMAKTFNGNDSEFNYLATYNQAGYTIKEEMVSVKKRYENVYAHDTLQYTIVTNLDRGEYSYDEPDSDYIDTLFVTSFEKSPRKYVRLALESKSGFRIELTSVDCYKESIVMYMKGEKMQDSESWNEDGNLIRVNTILYDSDKIVSTTYFTDYVFNNKGHWIERTVRYEDGVTASKQYRALSYY